MTEPFLLVQLSDLHVGAAWGDHDPIASLCTVLESVRELRPRRGAVLVSGDLTEHAADAEYARARELLETLEAPLHALPGNHDDRAALRRHFGLPGEGDEPVDYAADLGPLRLVVIDTTLPGQDSGGLDGEQLARLDDALADAPDQRTLLAMHHPPLSTGIAPLDEIGLASADRDALAAVVERHPQVRRLVAGHVHRGVVGDLAGRAVLAAPSTYLQARLDLSSEQLELVPEPPGFAVHAVLGGELVSHVQAVASGRRR